MKTYWFRTNNDVTKIQEVVSRFMLLFWSLASFGKTLSSFIAVIVVDLGKLWKGMLSICQQHQS